MAQRYVRLFALGVIVIASCAESIDAPIESPVGKAGNSGSGGSAGSSASGGAPSFGGSTAGASGAGGASGATGGAGAMTTGGGSSGGAASAGTAGEGTGGTPSTGGMPSEGGSSGDGGTASDGGTPGAGGSDPGACTPAATLTTDTEHTGFADDCVALHLESGWATVQPSLQAKPGTASYPVPFTWTHCAASGSGELQSDWAQVTLFSGANPGCDVIVQFGGTHTALKFHYYD